MTVKFKNEIMLAGLLHDIGKFYMRSGKKSGEIDGVDLTGTHQEISVKFINRYKEMLGKYVDIEATREMVQRHHEGLYVEDRPHLDVKNAPLEYKEYCRIISLADNISSSERGKEGSDCDDSMGNSEGKKLTYANAALHSVFSRVSGERYGYKFGEWSYENIQPIPEHDENDTKDNYNHIENFGVYMEKLSKKDLSNFNEMYNELYKLLQRFIWCCPSAYQSELRDISLFDHLSTTSAIAVSMYNELHSKYGDSFDDKAVKKAANNIVLFHIKLRGVEGLLDGDKSNGTAILAEAVRVQSFTTNCVNRIVEDVTEESSIANCAIRYGTEVFIIASGSESKSIDKKLVKLNKEIFDNSGSKVSILYSKNKLTKANGLDCSCEKMTEDLLVRMLSIGNKWSSDRFIGVGTSTNLGDKQSINISKSGDYKYAKVFRLKADDVLGGLRKGFSGADGDRDYHSISRVSTYMRMINFAFEDNINRVTEQKAINISLGIGESIIICNPSGMVSVAYNAYLGIAKVSSKTLKIYGAVIKVLNKAKTGDILGKVSKAETEIRMHNDNGGINYLDNLINWVDIRIINKEKIAVSRELKSNAVSNSVVHKLKHFSSMYKKYIETKDASYLMLFSSFNNINIKTIAARNSNVSEDFKAMLNEIFEACVAKENLGLSLLEVAIDESMDEA